MKTKGEIQDISEENILDRLSRLEDDMLLFEKRIDALLYELKKARAEFRVIDLYCKRWRKV